MDTITLEKGTYTRSMRVSEKLNQEIIRRGNTPSYVMRRDLDRYYAVIENERESFRRNFSPEEMDFFLRTIRRAGGRVFRYPEGIRILRGILADALEKEPELDCPGLCSAISEMSFSRLVTLVDMAELHSTGNQPILEDPEEVDEAVAEQAVV